MHNRLYHNERCPAKLNYLQLMLDCGIVVSRDDNKITALVINQPKLAFPDTA